MEIRKSRLSDVEEIANLQKELNLYHRKFDSKFYAQNKDAKKIWKKFVRKKIRDKNSILFVAVDKNKIVGYALGFVKKYPPVRIIKKCGYISDVFVDKNYRGKGIARKFISKLVKWFKTKKLRYVELVVDSRNKIGIKAWKQIGFKEYMKQMRMGI